MKPEIIYYATPSDFRATETKMFQVNFEALNQIMFTTYNVDYELKDEYDGAIAVFHVKRKPNEQPSL